MPQSVIFKWCFHVRKTTRFLFMRCVFPKFLCITISHGNAEFLINFGRMRLKMKEYLLSRLLKFSQPAIFQQHFFFKIFSLLRRLLLNLDNKDVSCFFSKLCSWCSCIKNKNETKQRKSRTNFVEIEFGNEKYRSPSRLPHFSWLAIFEWRFHIEEITEYWFF